MSEFICVIDEGTTSTRAIVFDRDFRTVAMAQEEIALAFPQPGWVEQDGEALWQSVLTTMRTAIAAAGGADRIAAIGLTNQRETTLVWERATGKLIAPAIVWQDRRTAPLCETLRAGGEEARVQSVTGLRLDPYFSATKLAWLLDSVPGARERAEAGELAFGTVDSFLIWRLTGGAVHATDVTNASRTALMSLASGTWSEDMARVFSIPHTLLPRISPSACPFGHTKLTLFGREIPILAAIGDQQGALFGQDCRHPGQAKITFGTGAFLVVNTGHTPPPPSRHGLLATVGYALPGETAYAREGAIFNTGSVVKWLRDELGLIADAAESERKAAALSDNGGVYLVPAFTGLGAPHWRPDARGLITGLARGTSAAHLVRAGLEAAAYQTRDLLDAFAAESPVSILRVDGGMCVNDWLMQFLADICNLPVERTPFAEMTALGAARLAALALGRDADSAGEIRRTVFSPSMPGASRARLIAGWQDAIRRTLA